jgi:hypothetical protein
LVLPVTLRDLRTGEYVTASLLTVQGRVVIHSTELGDAVPGQVLERYRVTYAADGEWAQLAAYGYPIFLKSDELESLGPMGNFAREVLLSCAGAQIREADWSWEDPILEVWWQGLRFRASFHESGPVLEYQVGDERRAASCSWSENAAECFQKFSAEIMRSTGD